MRGGHQPAFAHVLRDLRAIGLETAVPFGAQPARGLHPTTKEKLDALFPKCSCVKGNRPGNAAASVTGAIERALHFPPFRVLDPRSQAIPRNNADRVSLDDNWLVSLRGPCHPNVVNGCCGRRSSSFRVAVRLRRNMQQRNVCGRPRICVGAGGFWVWAKLLVTVAFARSALQYKASN